MHEKVKSQKKGPLRNCIECNFVSLKHQMLRVSLVFTNGAYGDLTSGPSGG